MNYSPLPGHSPALLHQDFVQALFTLRLLRQLTADQTYLLDRNHNAHTGAFVYENQVLRTKINYQFTRSLLARVIVEYDSNLENAAETTLARTKQVQTQALFTWLSASWYGNLHRLEPRLAEPEPYDLYSASITFTWLRYESTNPSTRSRVP